MQLKRATLCKIQLKLLPAVVSEEVAVGSFGRAAKFADFRFVTLDDCPAAFCVGFARRDTATESWQCDWRLVGGRGLDRQAALRGCLGELVERMSLLSRGDADPLVSASGRSSVPANDFLKFSARQQVELAARHAQLGEALKADGIDWSQLSERTVDVIDLATSKTEAIPSICLLLGEERHFGVDGEQIATSAGAAAHSDPEQARLYAMLELAEHDAVGIWWFNRLVCSAVALDVLDDGGAGELRRWLVGRVRETYLLRLPTDLPVHVTAAVSVDPDGGWIAYGFSARLAAAESAVNAVLEMLQCELSLRAMMDRMEAKADESDMPALLRWSMNTKLAKVSHLKPEISPVRDATEESVRPNRFLGEMRKNGVYLADIARSELKVPTVRAISSQLRDWMPRFAGGRMYSVPVKLGQFARPLSEEKLNDDSILI